MIPKSQHNDSFASQECRAGSIANLPRTIIMPATVQFDRELCGRTVEIQNVAVQRMLTAKFVTCKVAVPQMTPKNALRIGCFLSQQTSAIHEELSYSPAQFSKGNHPSPSSSPRKRGEAQRMQVVSAVAERRCLTSSAQDGFAVANLTPRKLWR